MVQRRQISKMMLVPEEVYSDLMAQKDSTPALATANPKTKRKTAKAKINKRPTKRKSKGSSSRLSSALPSFMGRDAEDAPIAETLSRMNRDAKNKNLPDDAKQVLMQQDFNRLQAMKQSRDDRPVLVNSDAPSSIHKMMLNQQANKSKAGKVLQIPPVNPLAGRLQLSVDEEHRADEILSYIAQHKGRLGINDDNQILNPSNRRKSIGIQNSHIRRNVEWEVFQGVKVPHKPPPGHSAFLANVRKDPQLSALLPGVNGAQGGSGAMHRFKKRSNTFMRRHRATSPFTAKVKKLLKKKTSVKGKSKISQLNSVRFKPLLW